MPESKKPQIRPFIRLDMRWWTAIAVLVAVALDWSVIVLVIVLLVMWPIVGRYVPLKTP